MQKTLLSWYDKNKRDFPWRTCVPNPYFVWLSEIMLQQTTTTTVVPYFLRFIEKYPTLLDLKNASLDDIYLLWQGLGYYSRARNLYKTACIIEAFPKSAQELQQLPGIGDYTSKAIAAIAFGEKVLPIDGNIRRVMARFFGLAVEESMLSKTILERITVEKRPGDFCQALMDLARKICLPKNPKCEECPLNQLCLKKTHLPLKKEKPSKKILYTKAFVIKNEKGIFLTQNQHDERRLLQGLWNVPMMTFSDMSYTKEEDYLGSIRHIFTHIDLRVDIYQIDKPICEGAFIEDISNVAISTLTKKIIRHCA